MRPLACNWYYCAQFIAKPKAACMCTALQLGGDVEQPWLMSKYDVIHKTGITTPPEEDRATAVRNMRKNVAKIGRIVLVKHTHARTHARTHTHTHTHADTIITILRFAIGGGIIIDKFGDAFRCFCAFANLISLPSCSGISQVPHIFLKCTAFYFRAP